LPERVQILFTTLARILRTVFRKFSAPRWLVFGLDTIAVFATFYLAYLLRYNLIYSSVNAARALQQSVIVMAVYTAFFFVYRTYQGRIRHTTIRDTFNLFLTTTSSLVVLLGVAYFSRHTAPNSIFHLSYSILFIHWGIITVALFFERVITKMLYELISSSAFNRKNILIYGAGSMGNTVKGVIESDKVNNFRIVGFLDDDKKVQRKNIGGIRVYSPKKVNEKFIQKHKVQLLLFAMNYISPSRKSKMIEKALNLGLELLETPRFDTWLNGELNLKQLRKVRPQDLLAREPIRLDMVKIQQELNGKTIMVTGAAGSIGSEIVRQLIRFDVKQLLLVDQAETPMFYLNNELTTHYNLSSVRMIVADVTHAEKMEKCFAQFRPDIVFHAAAYKHVPVMEEHPHEAFRVNVGGTKILTDLSIQFAIEKFVMVSSDKAVNPTNVMGATKRLCEMYVQSITQQPMLNTQFVTTRFGNVLGSNGSVIPLFSRQLEAGGPLTITHPEITRYFMTIPEACQLVLEAGFMGKGGEIYVFDMGDPVKIIDLAKQMIRLSGLDPEKDIRIEFTGLRPGEKLYEELLADHENSLPTHHPKILIARVREVNAGQVMTTINHLLTNLYHYSNRELVKKFCELVPEYHSSNKVYNGEGGD
jgi:FlaA1/EpsC-like NDP-sugar epimerase